jgi:hypothetical protein
MPAAQGNFGTGVRLHTDAQKVFVDTIKSYQGDDDLKGDNLRLQLQQDYPPFLLFQSGLISNVILMRKLWEFLGNREVAVTNHPSTYILNSLGITVLSGPAQSKP